MMTTDIRRWDVWTANVLFEVEPEGTPNRGAIRKTRMKPRPVIVLGERDGMIVALKVTSHPPRRMDGEFAIRNWSAAGLAYPSTVRSSQVLELYPCDLKRNIGRLDPDDAGDLDALIAEMYGTGMPRCTYVSRNKRKPRLVRRSKRHWFSRCRVRRLQGMKRQCFATSATDRGKVSEESFRKRIGRLFSHPFASNP